MNLFSEAVEHAQQKKLAPKLAIYATFIEEIEDNFVGTDELHLHLARITAGGSYV
jgi:hypothetical protein